MPKSKTSASPKKSSDRRYEEVEDLDRDDAPVEVAARRKPGKQHKDFYYPDESSKGKSKSSWGVIDPSKKEFVRHNEQLVSESAGERQKAQDARHNKTRSNSQADQHENENTIGGKIAPEFIKTLRAEGAEFLEEQLAHDKRAKKLTKQTSRNNAYLEAQADREAAYPNPKGLIFIGHADVKGDREKVKAIRANKILPAIQQSAEIQNRRPDLPFVIAQRIPAVRSQAQKRFKTDIGARLFMRMEADEKEILPVPRVYSYFSAREGEVKETIDPLAVWATLDPAGLTNHLERIASDFAKNNEIKSIPEAEAAKKLAKLRADLLAYEREEEALIRAAAREGMHILRRRDASLESIFGYEWKK